MAANDYNDRLWAVGTLTIEKVMNLFRYGSEDVPDDYGSHLRTTFPAQIVKIDQNDYMTNGGGRLVDPSHFKVVDEFFGGRIDVFAALNDRAGPVSQYQVVGQTVTVSAAELIASNTGIGSNNFRQELQQSTLGLDTADHLQRAFIFNTQQFQIQNNAQFVFEYAGNNLWNAVRVESIEVRVIDPSGVDDFDFSSSGFVNDAANNLFLRPAFDPFRLGTDPATGEERAIQFDYDTPTPGSLFASYDRAAYEADDTGLGSGTAIDRLLSLTARINFANRIDEAIPGLRRDGVIGTDDEGRFVVYGSNEPDGSVDPSAIPLLVRPSILNTFDDFRLVAGAGDDAVFGRLGDDYLEGNDGDDTLRARRGDDLLEGGEGADELFGQGGDDTLYANTEDERDSVGLDADADTLRGGGGDDPLVASAGEDSLIGGAGNDRLVGDGEDVLRGGDGDDWLVAGIGDRLVGGTGNDRITGASDAVVVFRPGDGDDHIDFDTATELSVDVILLDGFSMSDAYIEWDYTATSETTTDECRYYDDGEPHTAECGGTSTTTSYEGIAALVFGNGDRITLGFLRGLENQGGEDLIFDLLGSHALVFDDGIVLSQRFDRLTDDLRQLDRDEYDFDEAFSIGDAELAAYNPPALSTWSGDDVFAT